MARPKKKTAELLDAKESVLLTGSEAARLARYARAQGIPKTAVLRAALKRFLDSPLTLG